MKKVFILCLLLLGMVMHSNAQGTDPAYAAKLKSLYKETVPLITASELEYAQSMHAAPLILDTRTAREYAVSHIAGAIFIDYKQFSKKDVTEYARHRPVIVYCTVGYRSERIGEQLQEMGFKDVSNLYGGIFEWVNQGHDVVDAEGKPTKKVHAYSEEWGVWLKKGEKVY